MDGMMFHLPLCELRPEDYEVPAPTDADRDLGVDARDGRLLRELDLWELPWPDPDEDAKRNIRNILRFGRNPVRGITGLYNRYKQEGKDWIARNGDPVSREDARKWVNEHLMWGQKAKARHKELMFERERRIVRRYRVALRICRQALRSLEQRDAA
jgi:hypothetical protein